MSNENNEMLLVTNYSELSTTQLISKCATDVEAAIELDQRLFKKLTPQMEAEILDVIKTLEKEDKPDGYIEGTIEWLKASLGKIKLSLGSSFAQDSAQKEHPCGALIYCIRNISKENFDFNKYLKIFDANNYSIAYGYLADLTTDLIGNGNVAKPQVFYRRVVSFNKKYLELVGHAKIKDIYQTYFNVAWASSLLYSYIDRKDDESKEQCVIDTLLYLRLSYSSVKPHYDLEKRWVRIFNEIKDVCAKDSYVKYSFRVKYQLAMMRCEFSEEMFVRDIEHTLEKLYESQWGDVEFFINEDTALVDFKKDKEVERNARKRELIYKLKKGEVVTSLSELEQPSNDNSPVRNAGEVFDFITPKQRIMEWLQTCDTNLEDAIALDEYLENNRKEINKDILTLLKDKHDSLHGTNPKPSGYVEGTQQWLHGLFAEYNHNAQLAVKLYGKSSKANHPCGIYRYYKVSGFDNQMENKADIAVKQGYTSSYIKLADILWNYRSKGMAEKGINLYEKYLSDSNNIRGINFELLNLAECYLMMEKYVDALLYARYALDLNNNSKNQARAKAIYKSVVGKRGLPFDARYQLAMFERSEKKDASDSFTRLVIENSNQFKLLLMSDFLLTDIEKKQVFSIASKQGNNMSKADLLFQQGCARLKEGDLEWAARKFRQAGQAYFMLNKTKEVKEVQKKLEEIEQLVVQNQKSGGERLEVRFHIAMFFEKRANTGVGMFSGNDRITKWLNNNYQILCPIIANDKLTGTEIKNNLYDKMLINNSYYENRDHVLARWFEETKDKKYKQTLQQAKKELFGADQMKGLSMRATQEGEKFFGSDWVKLLESLDKELLKEQQEFIEKLEAQDVDAIGTCNRIMNELRDERERFIESYKTYPETNRKVKRDASLYFERLDEHSQETESVLERYYLHT